MKDIQVLIPAYVRTTGGSCRLGCWGNVPIGKDVPICSLSLWAFPKMRHILHTPNLSKIVAS